MKRCVHCEVGYRPKGYLEIFICNDESLIPFKKTNVKEQGTLTREYPGVEFPLQLSMCLKFNYEYDRSKTLTLLEFERLDSSIYSIMTLRSKSISYDRTKSFSLLGKQ